MSASSGKDFARSTVGRWRGTFELVSLGVVIGDLVYGLGTSLGQTLGRDGKLLYFGGVFSLEDLLVALAGVLMVVWLRVLFEWPEQTPSGAARAVLLLSLLICALVVISAAVEVAYLFDENYFSGADRAGGIVSSVGLSVAAAFVVFLALRAFSVIRGGASAEPSGIRTVDG